MKHESASAVLLGLCCSVMTYESGGQWGCCVSWECRTRALFCNCCLEVAWGSSGGSERAAECVCTDCSLKSECARHWQMWLGLSGPEAHCKQKIY